MAEITVVRVQPCQSYVTSLNKLVEDIQQVTPPQTFKAPKIKYIATKISLKDI